MIDVNEVKEYIEKKNNITLTPAQLLILKAIIRGDNIYTPRHIGRTTLYTGYANYMIEKLAKSTNYNLMPDEFDSVFTYELFFKDKECKALLEKGVAEAFKEEYECHWTTKGED